MKRLILIFALIATLGFATDAEASRRYVNTIISTTTLDDDPTSVVGTKRIISAKKSAVFVTYDETEVGNSISLAVTVDYSWDNSTWVDAGFYDVAGGSTLQTSETISADGNYYLWLDSDSIAPYVRVSLVATNTDADDIASVAAYLITEE